MNLRVFVSVLITIFLGSCASINYSPFESPKKPNKKISAQQQANLKTPWEFWSLGQDLTGRGLFDHAILDGDDYYAKRDYSRALEKYQLAALSNLSNAEMEALTLRIASSQLSMGETKSSLNTVSDYFSSRRIDVRDVDEVFSLFLGFAYGRAGDIDQSLAWFAKVNKLPEAKVATVKVAERAIKDIFAHMSFQQLDAAQTAWISDSFIYNAILQENDLRSRYGYIPPADENFWAKKILYNSNVSTLTENTLPNGSAALLNGKAAVLLPLTGEFSSVGKKINNGIELGLASGASANSSLTIATHDSMQFKNLSPDSQVLDYSQLLKNLQAPVIFGPLEGELTSQLSSAAKEQGISLISFSKKSNLPLGGGVFRIAPTSQDQTKSLVDAVTEQLQMKNFALLYPNDAAGEEFANIFRELIAQKGLKLSFEQSYNKEDHNAFVQIATKIETFDLDAIFFPDSLIAASRFRSSLSPDFRKQVRLLGTASWDDLQKLANSKTVLDGVIFPSPFYLHSADPRVQKFIMNYQARFNSSPDFVAAQGYDAAKLVEMALQKIALTQTGESSVMNSLGFIEALTSLRNVSGLTGLISVQENGEIARSFSVVQYTNGVLSLIKNQTQESQLN